MTHRPLHASEIAQLEARGCSAEDWSRVLVADPFLPERIARVAFSGDVRLGRLAGNASEPGAGVRPCGIMDARIHQATIGDECLVARVGLLANYDVADRVQLENITVLRVVGESCFGNGVEIEVMNEGGGRGLPLCDILSAQLAYLVVCYRHDPVLVDRLTRMIRDYAESRRAPSGRIGEGAVLRDVPFVANVSVGPHAVIEGAAHLEEGTIASTREAPARVGTGAVLRHFILGAGSTVEQMAIVDRCFVGQGVRIGRQFSAENCAIFCNSELFHGEACSVFAGPYTVSHHKSTLLIAGLCSFFNAGSGTNQSNHMYKLGPVHQGILERGCKTGSFSYLLWPSRVGAFSSVIGKHYTHFDAGDLPFSVIDEHDGRTVCVPGMNLFTVGTLRDSAKWPARDRRPAEGRLDHLHFQLWSPYLIGKVLRGQEKLGELAGRAREGQEYLNFNGIAVRKMLVRTAAKYYELAVRLFVGGCLVGRLEALGRAASIDELRRGLAGGSPGLPRWLDVAGLYVPEPELAELIHAVVDGRIARLDELDAAWRDLHDRYAELEWAWCARLLELRSGRAPSALTPPELAELVEQWADTVVKFNNMVLQDARKEFEGDVRLGYGLDSADPAVQAADFAAVRGTADSNRFVQDLQAASELARSRAAGVRSMLSALDPATRPTTVPAS